MKKQSIQLNNLGDQDATVDIIMALADMGFDIKCVMHESISLLQAEREFADSEESADTLH